MVFFVISAVILRYIFQFQFVSLWLMLLVFISMLWHVIAQQKGTKKAAADFAITIGGAAYLGCLGSYAISIRNMDNGLYWLLLTLPIISFADTGAYLIGRAFGKHKMLSVVSPKKSWEGFYFGLAGAIGSFFLFRELFLEFLTPVDALVLGLIVGVFGPMGDLVESLLKRDAGTKDSSNLLAGHGGFFDRFDSVIASAPVVYIYLQNFIKF